MIKENISEPIDWTTEEQQPSVTVYHRLEVLRESGLGISRVRATPADLISALAAMPAEDRAKVLDAVGPPGAGWRCYTTQERDSALARAEKAESERDAARKELEEVQRNVARYVKSF